MTKKSFNKRLSLFLTVFLMVSSPSATVAYAVEERIGDSDRTNTAVTTGLAETVVYNLGNQDVTVGYSEEQAEIDPDAYKLFDENGHYTLTLEDNAFFPYEVQFQTDGVTGSVFFDTPESVVETGGHTFGVYSERNDPTLLSQIGVWIDDEYVAALPEPKTFTSAPESTSFSLLPLTEVDVRLDLRGYAPPELKRVEMANVLSGQNTASAPWVVWAKKSYSSDAGGDYYVTDLGDIIDVSSEYSGNSQTYLELIVGDAKQLSMSNTRYNVTVQLTPGDEWLDFELYTQDDASIRKNVEVYRSNYQTYNDPALFYIYADATGIASREEAYLGMKWGSEFVTKSGVTVMVYKGLFENAEDAAAAVQSDPAIDVTASVWNQSMANIDAGCKADYTNYSNQQSFTFILKRNETIVGIAPFTVYVSRVNNGVQLSGIYQTNSDYENNRIGYAYSSSTQNGVQTITFRTEAEYDVNAQYYLRMYYQYHTYASYDYNVYVSRAVLGHYDTETEINEQPDIKSQLFPSSNTGGYLENYSGSGQNFTALDTSGRIFKFTVIAIQPEDTQQNIPNPGSSDTYFQMNGATGLSNVYVMPYEHDTYYDNGFQTVLTTDDADLASLAPTFWTRETVDVYSGSVIQTNGLSLQNFSAGAVQYAAAAEDGRNLKNYWVTFLKKHTGGPKLFVNGVNGPDGPLREVFLDNAYEYRHDVFIANVGDRPLEELTATLNATHVKLDPYWTVGGAGNDTLAAFTTTSKDYYDYPNAELANVAKIRLLPDGEGDISGTLTISAKGQDPVVITLTGTAGNPKITTENIPDAVKYVPYAALIQTNNKHDWNQVVFELTSGKLPEGVILKPNGEIYGVPRETGEFPVTVRANYSYSNFQDSLAEFTLAVQDNTDENVTAATDEGYEVVTALPPVVTVIQDQVFEVQGGFQEFMDFWLDGEKLAEDTDYIAEDGSTRITIRSQTFSHYGAGAHTIAAEFRVDGDVNKDLRRAAQNYALNLSGGGSGGGVSGGGVSGGGCSGGGGSGSGEQTSSGRIAAGSENTAIGRFSDVSPQDWFYGDVDYAVTKGWIAGVAVDRFAPNAPVTRGMLATILARVYGANTGDYPAGADDFSDVPPNQYYSSAIRWARAIGLITGLDDGRFEPDTPVKRQDVAVLFFRFTALTGKSIPEIRQIIAFADEGDISDYALESVRAMYRAKIISGVGNDRMNPQGAATRAETAAMLHRLQRSLEE
jgi:hypothetical protein